MDVVEIGSTTLEQGGVYRVKVLGVFAMIDDGELDWKVIAINEADPKAALVNDVEDVERYDDVASCLKFDKSVYARLQCSVSALSVTHCLQGVPG